MWAQGESDDTVGTLIYGAHLANLIQRVRAVTKPSLRVLLVQLAPQYLSVRADQVAYVAMDANARLVSTDDLTFMDGTHLDAASLQILAGRLSAMIR